MLKLELQENEQNTANLYLKGTVLGRISAISPSVINITGRFQPERKRVENFIQGIYANSYGADILVEYPTLMSVRNAGGDILAAVGFRYAGDEPLFLEQYTESPIENILSAKRSEVVEIGNLASAGGGASLFLFAALSSYLNNKKIKHATITGTDSLHRTFMKLGLNPQKICDASLASIQSDGQNWGSYYDTNPRVLTGSIEKSVVQLKRILGVEFEDCSIPLFSRLHYKD